MYKKAIEVEDVSDDSLLDIVTSHSKQWVSGLTVNVFESPSSLNLVAHDSQQNLIITIVRERNGASIVLAWKPEIKALAELPGVEMRGEYHTYARDFFPLEKSAKLLQEFENIGKLVEYIKLSILPQSMVSQNNYKPTISKIADKAMEFEGKIWLTDVFYGFGFSKEEWNTGPKYIYKDFPHDMGGLSAQYDDGFAALTLLVPKEMHLTVEGSRMSSFTNNGKEYIKYVKKAPLTEREGIIDSFKPAIEAMNEYLKKYQEILGE